MEACANDNPNALSSKRPCVATRPDVDAVQDIEERGETVSGPMLKKKRKTDDFGRTRYATTMILACRVLLSELVVSLLTVY